jgi:HTH-type transcriptional regulator/antitoxin HipB
MIQLKDPAQLAQILVQTRRKAGISQKELAELAGLGKTLVFQMEKGTANIRLDNLLKILKVLNIKIQLQVPE